MNFEGEYTMITSLPCNNTYFLTGNHLKICNPLLFLITIQINKTKPFLYFPITHELHLSSPPP